MCILLKIRIRFLLHVPFWLDGENQTWLSWPPEEEELGDMVARDWTSRSSYLSPSQLFTPDTVLPSVSQWKCTRGTPKRPEVKETYLWQCCERWEAFEGGKHGTNEMQCVTSSCQLTNYIRAMWKRSHMPTQQPFKIPQSMCIRKCNQSLTITQIEHMEDITLLSYPFIFINTEDMLVKTPKQERWQQVTPAP